MDNHINLTILNEISKAAKMGMDSISYLSGKVSDSKMKENLSSQYDGYDKIVQRVNIAFKEYGEIPDDASLKDEVMSWMGIQMNTLTDKSNSHIAEMLIQGGTMGIVECQKLMNHNPQANNDVKHILNEFMDFQQTNIDEMKKFL